MLALLIPFALDYPVFAIIIQMVLDHVDFGAQQTLAAIVFIWARYILALQVLKFLPVLCQLALMLPFIHWSLLLGSATNSCKQTLDRA